MKTLYAIHKWKILFYKLLLTKKGLRLYLKHHLLFLFFIPFLVNAQISFQMRTGYQIKTIQPFISQSVQFAAHGLAIQPEMVVTWRNDQPAYFGLKMSYQYQFIEAGYGRYFALFSLDKYDQYRNGWMNLFFVSGHWKRYFAEIDYDKINGIALSIGAKCNIGGVE